MLQKAAIQSGMWGESYYLKDDGSLGFHIFVFAFIQPNSECGILVLS